MNQHLSWCKSWPLHLASLIISSSIYITLVLHLAPHFIDKNFVTQYGNIMFLSIAYQQILFHVRCCRPGFQAVYIIGRTRLLKTIFCSIKYCLRCHIGSLHIGQSSFNSHYAPVHYDTISLQFADSWAVKRNTVQYLLKLWYWTVRRQSQGQICRMTITELRSSPTGDFASGLRPLTTRLTEDRKAKSVVIQILKIRGKPVYDFVNSR